MDGDGIDGDGIDGAGLATLGDEGCEPGLLGGLGIDGDEDGDWLGLGGRCVCWGDEGWVVLQPLATSRTLNASGNRNCLELGVIVAPG